MSYRISPSIIGSLTLTGCGIGDTSQWQGREIELSVCLDEPVSYDAYDSYDSYYYDCQNSDIVITSLPITEYVYDEILTHQYFLDIANRIGTLIIQQEVSINNRSYTSSYFLQAKVQYKSSRIIVNFGYPNLECEPQGKMLRCSWYDGFFLIFEPATTDILLLQ